MRPVLALMLALLAPLARADAPPEPREILVSAKAEILDSQTGFAFRLIEVDDQRCPFEVDCVWEGMMRVEIAVISAGSQQILILCNHCDDGEQTATLPGIVLRLDGLEPSTQTLFRMARLPVLQDYSARITLIGP